MYSTIVTEPAVQRPSISYQRLGLALWAALGAVLVLKASLTSTSSLTSLMAPHRGMGISNVQPGVTLTFTIGPDGAQVVAPKDKAPAPATPAATESLEVVKSKVLADVEELRRRQAVIEKELQSQPKGTTKDATAIKAKLLEEVQELQRREAVIVSQLSQATKESSPVETMEALKTRILSQVEELKLRQAVIEGQLGLQAVGTAAPAPAPKATATTDLETLKAQVMAQVEELRQRQNVIEQSLGAKAKKGKKGAKTADLTELKAKVMAEVEELRRRETALEAAFRAQSKDTKGDALVDLKARMVAELAELRKRQSAIEKSLKPSSKKAAAAGAVVAAAALGALGEVPSAMAEVGARMNGDGVGLILGVNEPILGWVLLSVFGLVWGLYATSVKSISNNDDEESGLSL